LTHYPFSNLSDLSFEFRTSNGIVYHAYFIAYGDLFPDYPEFAEDAYSFNLEVVIDDAEIQILDERVGLTVVAIFRYFFNSMQNVAIYICDSSDDRQLARKRKFDFWFWKYNDGSIVKEDGTAVIASFQIYNSLLVHKQNIFADKIITAFKALNEKADDK